MRRKVRNFFSSVALCALLAAIPANGASQLEDGFQNPPDSARPWVYWFWSDGNLSREGITADLEAMRRVGIGGVLIMEVDQDIPKGPVRFLSPQWRDLYKHVLREATRLGIQVNMNNDGGWSGSGGPWITPELSMQMMVWSETHVRGPRRFEGSLPQPKTTQDFYRDIAVLAFPTPAAEGVRMAAASPKMTWGVDHKNLDFARLVDGNPGTVAVLPPAKPGEAQYLNIEFSKPFAARALTIALDAWNVALPATLEVSEDGQHFRPVRQFEAVWPASSVNFDRISTRYYRIAFHAGVRPAVAATLAGGIPLGEVELHSGGRLEDIAIKAAFVGRRGLISSGPTLPRAAAIARDRILDLSAKMTPGGRLNWDAPAGNWTILRLGYTTTGKMNLPAPRESMGLECDKLSKQAVDVQFAGLLGKLVEDQRSVGAKALGFTHIDSWEVGSQNWTPRFREEFRQRRGYDPLLYLPVITGRVVGTQEVSERFLWDLRRTVVDMLLENYAGHMQELSHKHGLKLSIEAYGGGPLDDLAYAGRADMPVSEFWTGQEPLWVNKEMPSAGHVYGRPIIAAEAFTAMPADGKWKNHPFHLKALGDQILTMGVNRFIFHRYAMQPWMNRKPGMTMGQWGIHFERTNTWFEQSAAWLAYLARCQYMLQQGQFVADIAYLSSEKVPKGFSNEWNLEPAPPPGYDFDAMPAEVLLTRVTMREDRLTLPDGTSYRVLVLPAGNTMRPALLRKIKELVAAGATVVGPPPARSPSLENYPAADTEVRRLATELWGDCDGVNVTAHRFGKGRVVWGRTLQNALEETLTRPDFTTLGVAASRQVRYIHRTMNGSDAYFVANARAEAATFLCSFRVAGKRPELWWPDTGRIERIAVYDAQRAATRIPIRLEPYGSVFVVFPKDANPSPNRIVAVTRDGFEVTGLNAAMEQDLRGKMSALQIEQGEAGGYRIEVARAGSYQFRTADGKKYSLDVPRLPKPVEIEGPWELTFPNGWGAPERVTLDRLTSWTAHPADGAKYFSGTATYHRGIDVPGEMLGANRTLYLNLGRVQVIAGVKLNGRDLGIHWKPPFRVNITAAAKPGRNQLEVEVVNLWPNRLIGDSRLPDDAQWDGAKLKEWPQWLLEGKPSPTGRVTFTTWKHWGKDDPLLESGLLGPVVLESAVTTQVSAQ